MRVLICGSRTWTDPWPIRLVLAGLAAAHGGVRPILIHGAANGADQLAATQDDLVESVDCYPADWDRYGKRAGYVRNQQMLDEGRPDIVIAFRSEGKSNGTDMMVNLARAAGVETHVIDSRSKALEVVAGPLGVAPNWAQQDGGLTTWKK